MTIKRETHYLAVKQTMFALINNELTEHSELGIEEVRYDKLNHAIITESQKCVK